MDRIPEPELIEDERRVQAYFEADLGGLHSRFIDFFRASFGRRDIRGYVLDLGCGPAELTVRFARAYPNCFVHGIDGSEAMISCGRLRLEGAIDIQHRAELFLGRLQDDMLPRRTYDIIISNSLLHHLRDPQQLWNSVRLYATRDAPVLIMDLLRPPTEEKAQALVETHAAYAPQIFKGDFYHSLLAAFEIEEVVAQLREAGLAKFSVYAVSDLHMVIRGVNP